MASNKTMNLGMALGIVTLLGGGAGGLFGMMVVKSPDQASASDKTSPAAKSDAKGEPKPAVPVEANLVALTPIVVNLPGPQKAWIRLEASVLFEGKLAPNATALAGQIGQDLLAFLRTVPLEQIEGPSGLQHLTEDLNDRARIRSQGKVLQLVLHTLIVE